MSTASRRVVIAIDGPAGAGKSTVARRIAQRLRFTYIDSGAMYRAVALWALRQGMDPADRHRMEQLAAAAEMTFLPESSGIVLNGEDVTAKIRTSEVSSAASTVAAIAGVRRALVAKQREIAGSASVVMEGRDIGTVVFPAAEVKIYLDAQPEERARRRIAEIAGDAADVTQQIRERDARDLGRADSPLVQAPDAIYIDSTGLTLEEVEEAILQVIRPRISNGKDYS